MNSPGWLYAVACVSPFAALPAVWLAWRLELAVRVRWRMRALRRDGVL